LSSAIRSRFLQIELKIWQYYLREITDKKIKIVRDNLAFEGKEGKEGKNE
jgi:hypothetical protein